LDSVNIYFAARKSLNKKSKYKPSPGSHTVRDLPISERPREKLIALGADKLSESELLAILLRMGTRGRRVTELAQDLLIEFGSLHNLSKSSVEDLTNKELKKKIKGLGPAKAATLAAAFRIAQLVSEEDKREFDKKMKSSSITEPENAAQQIRNRINDFNKEQFYVASFDTRNRLLGIDEVTKGTLTASLVHPRETFEKSIRRHAASIIVAHNHPSGDSEPSEEDIKITKRLSEAGRIMGIELLDHIIITNNHYYSFKEKGMM
jgi:DNA repair protein RadC